LSFQLIRCLVERPPSLFELILEATRMFRVSRRLSEPIEFRRLLLNHRAQLLIFSDTQLSSERMNDALCSRVRRKTERLHKTQEKWIRRRDFRPNGPNERLRRLDALGQVEFLGDIIDNILSGQRRLSFEVVLELRVLIREKIDSRLRMGSLKRIRRIDNS
jgi:hypothetical protein